MVSSLNIFVYWSANPCVDCEHNVIHNNFENAFKGWMRDVLLPRIHLLQPGMVGVDLFPVLIHSTQGGCMLFYPQ